MVSSATGKPHLSRRQVGVGRKPRVSGNPTHRHHSPAYKRDINFQQKTGALGIQTKVWADISRWKTFCLPLIYKGAELFQNLYINSFYEWNTLTHSSKINYLLRWFIKSKIGSKVFSTLQPTSGFLDDGLQQMSPASLPVALIFACDFTLHLYLSFSPRPVGRNHICFPIPCLLLS